MTQTSALPKDSKPAAEKEAIRPFSTSVPDAELSELRRRVQATKWPERETVIHFNTVEKGGHFAAWEQPKLFSEEVRMGFRPLRAGAGEVKFAKAS